MLGGAGVIYGVKQGTNTFKHLKKQLLDSSSKILNVDFLNNVDAHRKQHLDLPECGSQSF